MTWEWLFSTEPPNVTLVIFFTALVISLINSGVYRLLISKMIGIKEYRRLQKELRRLQAEFRQILRSKDQKALEKFEKKRRKMLQIQGKIMKPQGYLYILSFSYILVWWFFLGNFYTAEAVAIIPGIAYLSGYWGVAGWYFLCSILFGTIFYRIFGITAEEEE
ncbi:MAG TPA: DUF106 domain-containing protein [Candidatus Bathyarchaeota archaeon]|nr:DUF106 domain-containing protein [Candidatus Bathyarchaeota archaeon]HEX69325.1 DUF106 domain-containing protein [Candidatus Bathyarchaeota archaeon]